MNCFYINYIYQYVVIYIHQVMSYTKCQGCIKFPLT